jgi:UDP-N-acetylglucosamine 4,6-dehydratase/5-epimerase
MNGSILITGGTGFLGRGILRQAYREGWDARFTVLSRDEHKQDICRRRYPGVHYVLGDVLDTARLADIMYGHDYVIHAAAMKYIPAGELNAYECVRVNVDGARSVIDAARVAHVRRVVGISTDKAAQPINTYGMTKAIMERLFAEATVNGGPTFTTCRYGNVLGSTGSVVPIMRHQFKSDQYVSVTDPDMTRFWMTVGEAVATVTCAFTAPPGFTVVPDPRAATMECVATAVLEVEGADYTRKELIRVIGKRPGEKQHEDLISHYELFRTVRMQNHYMIRPPGSEDYSTPRPTLSSDTAEQIHAPELSAMIRDAEGV